MPVELDTTIQNLITGAGGGAALAAVIAVGMTAFRQLGLKYVETKLIEPVRHRFATELADHQAALQQQMGEALKRLEADLARQKKDDDNIETLERAERPVLEEAGRVIRRIEEVTRGLFKDMYAEPWDSSKLKIDDINGNKKVTATYRLMRLFGAYRLYLQLSPSGIPASERLSLKWYFDKKIDPIFASGKMLGDYVMLRDTMMEVSDGMLNKSAKWDAVSLISFSEWIALCKDGDDIIGMVSKRIADLFSKPSIRLALLGVFLIDLRQDVRRNLEHESLRDFLLSWIHAHTPPNSLSIWGKTRNGRTDLDEMDLPGDRRPRNTRSPHFSQTNSVDYPISAKSFGVGYSEDRRLLTVTRSRWR
jgi:hypothetical protein